MKPRRRSALLLGSPRRRLTIRELIAVIALIALACAAVKWLDSHGQLHQVRVFGSPGFPWDLSDFCPELHPIHRWMTPVIGGGIGVGSWSLIYLYAPRRLDQVLIAIMAVLLLG